MVVQDHERKAARKALDSLRRRQDVFRDDALRSGDPSWAILLFLLAEVDPSHSVNVAACQAGAGTAPATTLRHLGYLEAAGLVASRACDADGRARMISLTPISLDKLRLALR